MPNVQNQKYLTAQLRLTRELASSDRSDILIEKEWERVTYKGVDILWKGFNLSLEYNYKNRNLELHIFHKVGDWWANQYLGSFQNLIQVFNFLDRPNAYNHLKFYV